MMRKFAARLTAMLVIVAMGSAQAVHLDPSGQGQVLLFPYYTAYNQQQTLISIVNTSDAAQVLQVTFREALNGRPTRQLKVWLGATDVWTATVFALADDGIASDGAGVLTRDRNCTTPSFFDSGVTTSGGVPYLPLIASSYSGILTDGGPGDLGRARQGWIEVIALANVTGALATAINISGGGAPNNCFATSNVAAGQDVATRPSGGLIGTASVIRVASGTLISSRAEALGGFTTISLFNSPFQPAVDLGSVNEGDIGDAVSALALDDQGRRQVLTYGGTGSASRPIDAVSAVLMSAKLKGEYQVSPAIGGATDWVITFPTKAFYTDPAIIGGASTALAPFDEAFRSPGTSRVCTPFRIFDQNQKTIAPQSGSTACTLGPIGVQGFNTRQFIVMFQAANVVAFNAIYASPTQSAVVFAPKPPGTALADPAGHVYTTIGPAGWVDLAMLPTNFNHRLPASAEGKVLTGLPAIGFAASNIINANVSNGVLANYAAATRLANSVTCVKASDGTSCD